MIASYFSATYFGLRNVIVASVASSAGMITVYRGTTWNVSITGMGDISDWSKIWFSVKGRNSSNISDINATVRIEKTAGLQALNWSASVTASDGSIAIDDATAGDITVTLKPASSSQISPDKGIDYDVKILRTGSSEVDELVSGRSKFTVVGDVTRQYS